MKITLLGSGASAGVPMIGCHCSVCSSSDLRNRRMRPSLLICAEEKRIVIDVGPDFRMQALTYGIDNVEAVVLTHAHSDHVAGLDELRAFTLIHKKKIPIYCSGFTLNLLKKRYHYLFEEHVTGQSYCAQLEFHLLPQEAGELVIEGIKIFSMTYEQEGMEVNGFRIGEFAYISDIRRYSEDIFSYLSGVKTLIIGALRKTPSYMHFSFEQAISFGRKIEVETMYLTHLSHEVSLEMEEQLPEGVKFAYDGLQLELENGR